MRRHLPRARRCREEGLDLGGGDRPRRQEALRGALPPRYVRPAGAGALREDSFLGERLARAPRARARSRARVNRAAQERQRHAAAPQGHQVNRRHRPERGHKAEYFANKNLGGPPVLTRTDEELNFDWGMSSPAPAVPADDFSARWTGKLVPSVSGKYRLGAIADDGVRVFLDGKLVAEDWTEHAPTTVTGEVTLEAGKAYDLKIEYYESKLGAVAKLVWQPPAAQQAAPYAEAVEAAKQADAVVLVLGLSSQLEGEEVSVR